MKRLAYVLALLLIGSISSAQVLIRCLKNELILTDCSTCRTGLSYELFSGLLVDFNGVKHYLRKHPELIFENNRVHLTDDRGHYVTFTLGQANLSRDQLTKLVDECGCCGSSEDAVDQLSQELGRLASRLSAHLAADQDLDRTNELDDLNGLRDSIQQLFELIQTVDRDSTNELQDLSGIMDSLAALYDSLKIDLDRDPMNEKDLFFYADKWLENGDTIPNRVYGRGCVEVFDTTVIPGATLWRVGFRRINATGAHYLYEFTYDGRTYNIRSRGINYLNTATWNPAAVDDFIELFEQLTGATWPSPSYYEIVQTSSRLYIYFLPDGDGSDMTKLTRIQGQRTNTRRSENSVAQTRDFNRINASTQEVNLIHHLGSDGLPLFSTDTEGRLVEVVDCVEEVCGDCDSLNERDSFYLEGYGWLHNGDSIRQKREVQVCVQFYESVNRARVYYRRFVRPLRFSAELHELYQLTYEGTVINLDPADYVRFDGGGNTPMTSEQLTAYREAIVTYTAQTYPPRSAWAYNHADGFIEVDSVGMFSANIEGLITRQRWINRVGSSNLFFERVVESELSTDTHTISAVMRISGVDTVFVNKSGDTLRPDAWQFGSCLAQDLGGIRDSLGALYDSLQSVQCHDCDTANEAIRSISFVDDTLKIEEGDRVFSVRIPTHGVPHPAALWRLTDTIGLAGRSRLHVEGLQFRFGVNGSGVGTWNFRNIEAADIDVVVSNDRNGSITFESVLSTNEVGNLPSGGQASAKATIFSTSTGRQWELHKLTRDLGSDRYEVSLFITFKNPD